MLLACILIVLAFFTFLTLFCHGVPGGVEATGGKSGKVMTSHCRARSRLPQSGLPNHRLYTTIGLSLRQHRAKMVAELALVTQVFSGVRVFPEGHITSLGRQTPLA